MVVVSTPILLSNLIEHQEQSEVPRGPEQSSAILKSDASTLHASTPGKDAHSSGLPPPGLAPPPAFVSPHFYETVRNTQPPKSPQTPSSTGATRGANSSSGASKQRDNSASPLKSMSAQNDSSDGDPAQESARTDASTSGPFHPPHAAPYQRSFQRQPFPVSPYYPGHSAPPQEQSYAPPYGQQPAPAPGFMGQYMASQPPLSMALQSPVQFGYSHSFAHPGIHAQDTSALGMPFGHPPQPGRSFVYSHPPGSNPETHAGDRGRSGPGYAGPSAPFTDTPGARQQPASAPATTAPHMSHHGYSPVHYSQPQASPHYAGYPTHSFAHSSPPGVYSYSHHPGPYPQSFYGQQPASPEDTSKGTWWYLPPSGAQQYDASAYQPGYPIPGYQPSMQMGRTDYDPYASQAQPGPSSPPPFAGPSHQQTRAPPVIVQHRERPVVSPVAARATASGPDPQRASSPPSKKRSPNDTASSSPPAASRKSYHPNPPPNRSEWVMWVGNVPSDATHDELWRFFNQPAPAHAPLPGTSAILSSRQVRPTRPETEADLWGGVASVFLISRSNCAFVNFETEQHLARAVSHFNGKPIRPKDPRCPRLVCRVRRKDDDLKAGVGGQRGMGLHTRWVAEQKERGRERERELEAQRKANRRSGSGGEGDEDTESSGEGPPTSPSTYLAPSSSSDPSPPIPAVSPMDEPGPVAMHGAQQDREPRHGSSGDRSFASTNSSFLANNFPKRYFILKSLTQYDLNLSLDRGIWATQPHNEGILDQAYRTSSDVYLIFGVNKSGEFFGYARMSGPIFHNERVDHVSWASRSSGSGRGGPEAIKEEDETDRNILPPTEHRLVDESPAPVTPGEDARLKQATRKGDVTSKFDEEFATAPPELHDRHKPMSGPFPLRAVETLPERQRRSTMSDRPPKAVSDGPQYLMSPKHDLIDPAQIQAQRDSSGKVMVSADLDGVRRKDTLVTLGELRHRQGKESSHAVNTAASIPHKEQQAHDENPHGEEKPEGWGREFKIQWIRTERLPFHRTRHLRNPWNHDREVKVSRDGTELEPVVGQMLLDEWDKPAPEVDGTPPTSPASRGRGSRAAVRAAGGMAGAAATSTPSSSFLPHRTGSSSAVGQGRGRGAPPP